MKRIYGYCRISTKQQNIDRQERNILKDYPTATIVKESYSGRTLERPKWQALAKKLHKGDTLVFDSVSRMSRNAEEGASLYLELYNKGINLVFLKESYINTEVYQKALDQQIPKTNTNVDIILKAVETYLQELAKEQVYRAFEQAQKEVDDLRQRTKEGLETAKRNGKQIGQAKGNKLTTKKSVKVKEQIQKLSKSFNGTLADNEVIELVGIARNTYYKYKKELVAEQQELETYDNLLILD